MLLPQNPAENSSSEWTFLSNHAHVLLVIARDPGVRQRDLANLVGITERAVQRIVSDLESSGYLTRLRMGRRNQYRIHPTLSLRHPIESHCSVARLLALVLDDQEIQKLTADSQAEKNQEKPLEEEGT